MKILIVDDDALSRMKLARILSVCGVCEQTGDGREAFTRFRTAFQRNDPYDLITLDVTMPGQSGRETLRQIRDWERTMRGSDLSTMTPVLVVSIHDDQETAVSMLGESGDAYIVKPVSPEKIKRAFDIMRMKWPSEKNTA